jgi:hypothetical protein
MTVNSFNLFRQYISTKIGDLELPSKEKRTFVRIVCCPAIFLEE